MNRKVNYAPLLITKAFHCFFFPICFTDAAKNYFTIAAKSYFTDEDKSLLTPATKN